MLKTLKLILPWLILSGIVLGFSTGHIPSQFVKLFSGIIFLLTFLQVLKKHKNPKEKLEWLEYLELILSPLASLFAFYAFWVQMTR